VDPYGLLARAGFWYLVGYDHLRADRRTFRIDRIDGEISVGDRRSFNRPKDFDLQKAVPTEAELLAEGHGEDAVATVLVDASLASGVEPTFCMSLCGRSAPLAGNTTHRFCHTNKTIDIVISTSTIES
jgi:hypothetical protein